MDTVSYDEITCLSETFQKGQIRSHLKIFGDKHSQEGEAMVRDVMLRCCSCRCRLTLRHESCNNDALTFILIRLSIILYFEYFWAVWRSVVWLHIASLMKRSNLLLLPWSHISFDESRCSNMIYQLLFDHYSHFNNNLEASCHTFLQPFSQSINAQLIQMTS